MGATLWGWGCQNGRRQESRLGPPWLSTFKGGYESRMFFSRAWRTPENFFFFTFIHQWDITDYCFSLWEESVITGLFLLSFYAY